MQLSIHNVERIELARTYPSNGNSRTLRIVHRDGHEFEITVYGKTDTLDALPKSAGYVEVI